MSATPQIVIASNNLHVFNVIKENMPAEYSLEVCDNTNELLTKLIRQPEIFGTIIIAPTADNLNLLRQINNSSKTKTLPVIMELNSTPSMSDADIDNYIRAGVRYCLPESLDIDIVTTTLFTAVSDRKRYLVTEYEVSAENAATIMINAEFKFKLLEEAQSLASLFANACPNPKLAVIGIAEILINAVEHGNLGISYVEKTKLQSTSNWFTEVERRINLPENNNKYVTAIFSKNNEHIKIYVQDSGKGFDWNKFQYLDSSRIYDSHGRGIIMAKNLAFDRLEYLNKGNEVNCYINLPSTT